MSLKAMAGGLPGALPHRRMEPSGRPPSVVRAQNGRPSRPSALDAVRNSVQSFLPLTRYGTTPSSSSSCLIARDKAGGDSCIHSAALRTLAVSATTEKYVIPAMFIVSLSLTVDHKDSVIANGH